VLESVSAASDAKAVFLANMSHELRTPLNAVIGFCELISMEPLGPLGHPRYREYVDDINKSGLHLLTLVNDILDLSRIESGKAELDEREICIGQIIGEVCQVLELDVVKDGLQIAVNLRNDLPNVRADERRIIQILSNLLSNLLSNAIKFSPAPGTISLDVVEHADGVTIWVRDNGSGIAKTDISKVMERFGQAESRIARKHAGTGLGLPLAKQLMELHGGTLMIESDLGRGTSVGVNFPVSRIVRKAASNAA